MPATYLSCVQFAADGVTCTQTQWVEAPSFLPSLSLGDGALIGCAILTVWCAAYMSRALRTGGGN